MTEEQRADDGRSWWRGRRAAERPWRVAVTARARLLRTMALDAALAQGCTVTGSGADARVVRGRRTRPGVDVLANAVLDCAQRAERYAGTATGPVRWLTGTMLEGAWANLHGAEERLIELLPDDDVRGQLPVVEYQVRRFLRPSDPRRVAVETRIVELAAPAEPLTPTDRALFANALRGVYYRNSASFIRVRSLRNTQLGFALLFFVLAAVLAVLAVAEPARLSLCVETSTEAVFACPAGEAAEVGTGHRASGWDVPLVELAGLVGAAVAAARAVTGLARPAAPYSVVVAQSLLKMTLGAVTAVLGVWFLRAGLVPGVDDVDTQTEILVWAVVFGYAQQVLTQLIDKRSATISEEPVATPGDEDEEDEEVRASAR